MSFRSNDSILKKSFFSRCGGGFLVLAALLLVLGMGPVANPARAQDVVFLSAVSGSDAYQVADGSSPGYSRMQEMVETDPAVRKAILNYKMVQLERKLALKNSLVNQGMDKETIELLMASYQIKPVYLVLDQTQGSNYCALGDLKIIDRQGGRAVEKVLADTPAVHLSMNGQTMKSNDRGDISRSISHELAHGTMGIAYGSSSNLPQSEYFGKPHWRSMVSDRAMSLVEGWAEANGPYFSGDSRFVGPIEENSYSLGEDGTLKNFEQMMCTEGFVATMFYNMISDRSGIEDAYAKILDIFSKGSPESFEEFALSFMDTYPQDAGKIMELFIALTGGACVSNKSADMYAGLLTGRISPAEYSKWLDGLKTGNMENLRKTLAAGAAAGSRKKSQDKGGFSDSRRGGKVSDVFTFRQDQGATSRVTPGAVMQQGLDGNADPYTHYKELVEQGKRNTPEARKALREAMEASRLQSVKDQDAELSVQGRSSEKIGNEADQERAMIHTSGDRGSERIGQTVQIEEESALQDQRDREEIAP